MQLAIGFPLFSKLMINDGIIICLKSKYLLPPYKFLRNYFNYYFISSCHYFTLVVLVCLINLLLWICFILASYFAIAYPLYIARIIIEKKTFCLDSAAPFMTNRWIQLAKSFV